MRGSLWFRLTGAFLVVIAAGAMATYAVVNLVTATQFRRFVLAEDVAQAQALTAPLADFYASRGGWEGVEELLAASQPAPFGPGMMGPGMMGMMGGGMRGMMGRSADEMFELMRNMSRPERVVLLDSEGRVVADTTGASIGEQYPVSRLDRGAPVLVDSQRVGTVLVGSMIEPTLNPLGQDFLRSVNLSVLAIAVLGSLAALILGSLLFRQITAPVSKVAVAAEAVAAGDLNQRVEEEGAEELRRLARSFNRMAANLAQAERLRRNLIADVAHELRTPLMVMQGNLEALMDGVFELNRENLATVHEETLLLARLVADLRDLARAEAGELDLQLMPGDVGDLVRRVAGRLAVEASEKGVTLETSLPAALPQVRMDPQRIEQVLYNLLANALRHTPPGESVTVTARQVDGQVEVVVSDTGEGIAAKDLPYVFERFFRADRSRSRATGGSGLGLTIAKQLVEAHGGRIQAESAGPGRGSTFRFTLPVAAATASTIRTTSGR